MNSNHNPSISNTDLHQTQAFSIRTSSNIRQTLQYQAQSFTLYNHAAQTSQGQNDISTAMDGYFPTIIYPDPNALFGTTRRVITNDQPRQSRLYRPAQIVTSPMKLSPLSVNYQEALFGSTRLDIFDENPQRYQVYSPQHQLYSPQSAWSTSSLDLSLDLSLERSWTIRTPSELTAKVFRPWYRKAVDSLTRMRRWSAGKRARLTSP